MPLKRKSTVGGQLKRISRSKRIAVDGAQHRPSLDPFAHMNRDVTNLILHYLSLPDIARCESVCKGWKDTIHWWLVTFGFRVHFPHIFRDLLRSSDGAIYEAFKVQARQQNGIRSGKLSSMQEFDFRGYYNMTIMGNFVAGQTQDEPYVSWRELAVPGGAVVNTKTVPLKKVWRVHVILMGLEMNQEGLLLLRLREAGKTRARSAVYSPIEGKTVWRQDHRHNDPRYGVRGELTPILIGRSVLHCARRGSNRDTFDLVGIDFRTSKPTVLYESSTVGPKVWPHSGSCRRLLPMGEQHELVLLSDTENWVGTGRISILNGENGQLLFQFGGGPAHFYGRDLLAFPTINQFLIYSVPSLVRLGNAVKPWEDHANAVRDFIIMQMFSLAFSGSDSSPINIVRLGADVLLSPCSYHKIAIQPCAQVAVVLQPDGDTILSYPLVKTTETHLIQMAEAVLKESFPPDSAPPNLRHCFVLQGEGTKISGRPSSTQPGPLAFAPDIRMRSVEGFVDGGRLLLQASQAQFLLEF